MLRLFSYLDTPPSKPKIEFDDIEFGNMNPTANGEGQLARHNFAFDTFHSAHERS